MAEFNLLSNSAAETNAKLSNAMLTCSLKTGKAEVPMSQPECHCRNPAQCQSYLVWCKGHLSSKEKIIGKPNNFNPAANTAIKRWIRMWEITIAWIKKKKKGNITPFFHNLSTEPSPGTQCLFFVCCFETSSQSRAVPPWHPRRDITHASGSPAHSIGDIFMLEQRKEFLLSLCSP